jgi:ankyrin repeat protein
MLNQYDESGFNVLHYVCQLSSNHSKEMEHIHELLVNYKVDLHLQTNNKHQLTPLFLAIQGGNIHIVDYYLKQHVDINQIVLDFNNIKMNVFLYAITINDLEIVKKLLSWSCKNLSEYFNINDLSNNKVCNINNCYSIEAYRGIPNSGLLQSPLLLAVVRGNI